jgi:hypothetical protein
MGKDIPPGFLRVPMRVMPRASAVSIASDVAADTPVTISAPSPRPSRPSHSSGESLSER